MIGLVGCTGFVGSNILESAGGKIGRAYHSTDIGDAYGTNPDLLIYAGLRAEKFLANADPEGDMARIREAEDNIEKISPRRLVLISTIDVLKDSRGVSEDAPVSAEGLAPYGYNRLMLERWVRERYPDALIIRLPGLYGKNIKKNLIYDYINVIPSMLRAEKMEELSERERELAAAAPSAPGGDAGSGKSCASGKNAGAAEVAERESAAIGGAFAIRDFYELGDNGFYRLRDLSGEQREALRGKCRALGFTALNFTDSRSRYQFYDLSRLWGDICTALSEGMRVFHPATEPVSAGELCEYLSGEPFINELGGAPADYDYRTIYAGLFGGSGGYICGKGEVMASIRDFVESQGGILRGR